jgi:hypothetical protein
MPIKLALTRRARAPAHPRFVRFSSRTLCHVDCFHTLSHSRAHISIFRREKRTDGFANCSARAKKNIFFF